MNTWARLSNVKAIESNILGIKSDIARNYYKRTETDQLLDANFEKVTQNYLPKTTFLEFQDKQAKVEEHTRNHIRDTTRKMALIDKEFAKHALKIKSNKEEIELRESIAEVDIIREKF